MHRHIFLKTSHLIDQSRRGAFRLIAQVIEASPKARDAAISRLPTDVLADIEVSIFWASKIASRSSPERGTVDS